MAAASFWMASKRSSSHTRAASERLLHRKAWAAPRRFLVREPRGRTA